MVSLFQLDEKTRDKLEEYGLTSRAAQVSLAATCGSVATLGFLWTYRRYWRRIPNAEAVPARAIAQRRWINGIVTSVGDADNFRLYHTPGPFWRWPLKLRRVPKAAKELQGQTIHIRMAGVDAPEAPHFGKPGQPYAKEALEWLKGTVEGRRVWCQLVRRDQYSRIVGVPHLPPRILPSAVFRGRNISLMMISAGWGETYDQSGGEYGSEGKARYQELEAQARSARRGMWASGKKFESAAAFKKRTASGDVSPAPSASKLPPARGLVSRMISRSKKR